jgi:hypothetical protein
MIKLLALVVWSVLSASVALADVSGTWNLEMSWDSGSDATGVCTFKQEVEKLTGTCGGADKFPVTGEVNDRDITVQVDVEQDGNKGRMIFTGAVDEPGTTIKGACRIVGGQAGTFTMRKQ